MLEKHVWRDYIFHKQTLRELSETYDKDQRTLRNILSRYRPPEKKHRPRDVYLVVDGTYFGERKEDTSWCVIGARDPYEKEDLVWTFADTETTSGYLVLRDELENAGYIIKAVTGDGFSGIKTAFSGIPYQMCHVHMERIVVRGTTKNPKTEQGQALLALVRTLHEGTDSHTFHTRLKAYWQICKPFLDEKTFNEDTGKWDWTHRPLRQAATSLLHHEKYLFTFEHDRNIPKNTNSIEGHFKHVKRYLGQHSGTERTNAERILHSLLLASSVSPTNDVLKKNL